MQPDTEELRAYLSRDPIYEWKFTNENIEPLKWNRTVSLDHCVPFEEEEKEEEDDE